MAWTPADINTELWLDAADSASITKDGSENVSQWNDKSGNGRHAVQASASLQPVLQSVDGYPAIVTNAGVLTIPASKTAFKFLHVNGGEIYAVFQVPSSSDLPSIIGNNGGSSNNAGVNFGVDSRGVLTGFAPCLYTQITRGVSNQPVATALYNSASTFYPVYQDVLDYSTMTYIGVRYDPTAADSDRLAVNKFDRGFDTRSTGGYAAQDVDATYDMDIGAIGNQGLRATSTIREIIIVDGQLADADRTLLTKYLAQKWGFTDKLVSYHPGATVPTPATQISTVSGTVQVNGSLTSRVVRAFSYDSQPHDIDGEPVSTSRSLGQTTSDNQTGEYSLELLDGYDKRVFVVAFDDYGDAFAPGASVTPGDRIHPTVPNGYVYECSGAGELPSTEPTWSTDTGSDQLVGTASFTPTPFYRPMVQGPVAPDVTILGVGDQFYDQVSLLLHFDGNDGDQTTTDDSGNPATITMGSLATIDINKFKFGGSSLHLTGSAGSIVTTDRIQNVGTGTFTLEAFVAPNSAATMRIISSQDLVDYQAVVALRVNSDGALAVFLRDKSSGAATNYLTSASGIVTMDGTTWHHVAVTRDQANLVTLWLDGQSVASMTAGDNPSTGSNTYDIGHFDQDQERFVGWIDDVRITEGVCRYSQNFTPVTSAFPNFASGYSPATVFASGESGAWYDPSDLSTLFQDTAKTVPVTADGDPVAAMEDKSGNGEDMLQATSSARPIYRTNGTQHWLEFNGSTHYMQSTSAPWLNTASQIGVFTALDITSPEQANFGGVISKSLDTASNYAGFNFNKGNDQGLRMQGLGANQQAVDSASRLDEKAVYTGLWIAGQELTIRYNGLVKDTVAPPTADNPDSGSQLLTIGRLSYTAVFKKFNFYGAILVVDNVEANLDDLEGYVSGKIGVAI